MLKYNMVREITEAIYEFSGKNSLSLNIVSIHDNILDIHLIPVFVIQDPLEAISGNETIFKEYYYHPLFNSYYINIYNISNLYSSCQNIMNRINIKPYFAMPCIGCDPVYYEIRKDLAKYGDQATIISDIQDLFPTPNSNKENFKKIILILLCNLLNNSEYHISSAKSLFKYHNIKTPINLSDPALLETVYSKVTIDLENGRQDKLLDTYKKLLRTFLG